VDFCGTPIPTPKVRQDHQRARATKPKEAPMLTKIWEFILILVGIILLFGLPMWALSTFAAGNEFLNALGALAH